MKLYRASDFVNENILDDMEQQRKEIEERDRKNAEMDAEIKRKQAEYLSTKPIEPIGIDRVKDDSYERKQLLTKVGDILLYSSQENNDVPKNELNEFINKYSNYLKLNSNPSESVKTFKDFK
jgi:proline dehydrogenase